MKIHNGKLSDISNIESNSYLQINSCGIQLQSGQGKLTFRKEGRIRVFDNKIKINIVLGFEKPIFFCQFCIFLLHVTYRYCIMLMKNIFAQITVKERT